MVVPRLACLSLGWGCGGIFCRSVGVGLWVWFLVGQSGVGLFISWLMSHADLSVCRSVWVGHLCLIFVCADLCRVVCLFVWARLCFSVALFLLVAGCGFWWCWIVSLLICFRLLCGFSFGFFELCNRNITVHPFRVDFGLGLFRMVT